MVSLEQIQNGIADYIDTEIVAKMSGWQKWAVGTAAAVILQRVPEIVEQAQNNPLIKAMGVVDSDGMVDLDILHKELKAQAHTGPITTSIPMIGPIKFSEEDVDKLYTLIINK